MTSRQKLSKAEVDAFVAGHPGWTADGSALSKSFDFRHYGAGMGFAVHLGFAAEKRDHHPELVIGWRKVRVSWSTHDAGGITGNDLACAARTETIASRAGAKASG